MVAPEGAEGLSLEAFDRRALRYVEKQSRIATSELVDNQAEQQRLEELLEAVSYTHLTLPTKRIV